jgi:hypothetical protein
MMIERISNKKKFTILPLLLFFCCFKNNQGICTLAIFDTVFRPSALQNMFTIEEIIKEYCKQYFNDKKIFKELNIKKSAKIKCPLKKTSLIKQLLEKYAFYKIKKEIKR